MKYALLASSMALGLALQPVQAAEQDAATTKAHEPETLHAPTNRVGDMVPMMTAPRNTAETMHAPTNRVGDQVPTMKSAENKDERTKSTTTNSATSPD